MSEWFRFNHTRMRDRQHLGLPEHGVSIRIPSCQTRRSHRPLSSPIRDSAASWVSCEGFRSVLSHCNHSDSYRASVEQRFVFAVRLLQSSDASIPFVLGNCITKAFLNLLYNFHYYFLVVCFPKTIKMVAQILLDRIQVRYFLRICFTSPCRCRIVVASSSSTNCPNSKPSSFRLDAVQTTALHAPLLLAYPAQLHRLSCFGSSSDLDCALSPKFCPTPVMLIIGISRQSFFWQPMW